MQQKNQYYYLVISLMFFSTLVYVQNMFADNNQLSDQSVINVYSDQREFTVKLKSNPTTGYKWFLDELNEDFITAMDQEYVASKTNQNGKPLIGNGGFDVWTFKVRAAAFKVPRVTMINFSYIKPWANTSDSESDLESNNNVEIKVIINSEEAPKIEP